jgi:hypothetical protein
LRGFYLDGGGFDEAREEWDAYADDLDGGSAGSVVERTTGGTERGWRLESAGGGSEVHWEL